MVPSECGDAWQTDFITMQKEVFDDARNKFSVQRKINFW